MKIEVKEVKSTDNDFKVFVDSFDFGYRAAKKAWEGK